MNRVIFYIYICINIIFWCIICTLCSQHPPAIAIYDVVLRPPDPPPNGLRGVQAGLYHISSYIIYTISPPHPTEGGRGNICSLGLLNPYPLGRGGRDRQGCIIYIYIHQASYPHQPSVQIKQVDQTKRLQSQDLIMFSRTGLTQLVHFFPMRFRSLLGPWFGFDDFNMFQ